MDSRCNTGARMAMKLVKVLLPSRGDRVHGRAGVDRFATGRTGVKPCQFFGDGYQVILDRLTVCHQRGQPAGVRVASHDDHRLGGRPSGSAEMGDSQVAVRVESAVQDELAHAGPFATIRRAEVEEVGHHRLLGLVGLVAEPELRDLCGFRALRLCSSPGSDADSVRRSHCCGHGLDPPDT